MAIRTGAVNATTLVVGQKNRVAALSASALVVGQKNRIGSLRVEAMVLAVVPPLPPQNLTAYDIADTSASFIWTLPTVGEPVVRVEYSVDGGPMVDFGMGTQITLTGLTKDVQHTFRVRSVGAEATSAWATVVFTTTAGAPNPPTNVVISNITANGATANWTAPSSGPAVTGYEYSVSDSAPESVGTATQAIFTNATPNTAHTFKVRSMGEYGVSAWVEVPFTTKGAPSAPSGLSASNVAATSARVSWATPAGGTPATGHRYSIDYGDPVTIGLVNQVDLVGLAANEQHLIRVQAFNAYGDSPWSSVSLTTTVDVPDAPAGLAVTSVTTTSATANWLPVQSGFAVNTYEIQLDTNAVVDLNSMNPSVTIDNLQPGTTHILKVRGRNATGVSAWSSVEFQTILGAPNPPVDLQATKIEQTGAIVTWGPSLTGPASVSYEYSLNFGEVTSAGTIKRLVFENLLAGSKLNLRVRAVGVYATSDWAELEIQLLPADVVPDATLRLQWDQLDKRYYEEGLDRGVLYLSDNTGVAWNGLTGVDETLSSEGAEPLYMDGRKYLDDLILGDFEASVRALTYPDEFAEYEGFVSIGAGILADDQEPRLFGLCYRTQINDASPDDLGHYKLHLVYNLTAIPDAKSHSTRSNDPSLTEFGWTVRGVPVTLPGYRPTAHVILDSRDMNRYILKGLEDILYGDGKVAARLPTLAEVKDFVENFEFLVIIDNGDGTWTARGPDELIQMLDPTTFMISEANATYSDEYTYTIRNS